MVRRRRIKVAIAVVFVLLNVADNMTTMHGLHLGGGLVEGNPVMAFVQWLAGQWWPIVKILAASAIAWIWVLPICPMRYRSSVSPPRFSGWSSGTTGR